MATDSSFDVVSRVDLQEVRNALQQAQKELSQRYDFKGSQSSMDLSGESTLVLVSDDDHKLKSVVDILQGKLVRRGISLKSLEYGSVEPAQKGTVRQEIEIQSGLTADMAREVAKAIKDAKLKRVQAAIQGDTVRISAPSKDDLQSVIALLKQQDFGVELQFGNYRSN